MSAILIILGLYALWSGHAQQRTEIMLLGFGFIGVGLLLFPFTQARRRNSAVTDELRTMLLDSGELRIDFVPSLKVTIPTKRFSAAALLTNKRLILKGRYAPGDRKQFQSLSIILNLADISDVRSGGPTSMRFLHQGAEYRLEGAIQKILKQVQPSSPTAAESPVVA